MVRDEELLPVVKECTEPENDFFLIDYDVMDDLKKLKQESFKDMSIGELIKLMVYIIKTIIDRRDSGWRLMFFNPTTSEASLWHDDYIYGAHPSETIH